MKKNLVYIDLPAIDKRVSLKQYMRAIKMAKLNPDVEFKTGLSCWWSCTGREVMRQFMHGVHDRINQAIPYIERTVDYRKRAKSWQNTLNVMNQHK